MESSAYPVNVFGNEITVSEVVVSTGTVSYGNFSNTFGGNHDFIESSAGWTATDALSAKNLSFTVTADPGYMFDLTEFDALFRSTNAGPAAASLIINGSVINTTNAVNSDGQSWSESGLNLTGLTSATIQMAGWNNSSRTTSGGGAFRVGAIEGFGNVQAIPEPGTLALIGISALILYFRRRFKA